MREREDGGLDLSLQNLCNTLLGLLSGEAMLEEYDEEDLRPVPPSTFRVLDIDDDIDKILIKLYALDQGLTFKAERGFYDFTKPEHISMKKDIVLMRKDNGNMFTGLAARKLLNITEESKEILNYNV